MSDDDDLLSTAQRLKTVVMSIATGGPRDGTDYWTLRQDVGATPHLKPYLPQIVRVCRNPNELWAFIQPKLATYHERREYLNAEFEPLLTHIEQEFVLPAHDAISAVLNRVDAEHVRGAWHKALDRRITDPDGALTMARTLLEATCKHILDEAGDTYSDKDDLPALYYRAVQRLTLAPNQQTEQSLKRALGSCQTIVQEIGVLRNKMGDAHGKGKDGARAYVRHAELAVNLGGAIATFLIASWEDRER